MGALLSSLGGAGAATAANAGTMNALPAALGGGQAPTLLGGDVGVGAASTPGATPGLSAGTRFLDIYNRVNQFRQNPFGATAAPFMAARQGQLQGIQQVPGGQLPQMNIGK